MILNGKTFHLIRYKINMAKIIKPDSNSQTSSGPKIFLAGSIEMGKAIDWQSEVENLLSGHNVTVYNPRRISWDMNWEQCETNPEFRNQVNWEMNNIDNSDIIFMNFVEDTMSPISLLELGYISGTNPSKLIVCCPKKFWRRGNVQIVCSRESIPLFDNIEEAMTSLLTRVEKLTNI
jgi:hypothetical protein